MSIHRREGVTEPSRLIGYVERSGDGADTYTIAPDDVAGYDLMSQWISAPADVVESLDAMR